VVEKLRHVTLSDGLSDSLSIIAPALLALDWRKIVAMATIRTVKAVASIKNDKPRLLPPRVYKHQLNLYLIKLMTKHVIAYFSIPKSYRLSIHHLIEMVFYRIDEIPKELWQEYISLMTRVGVLKYRLPEEVSKTIVLLAALLRLALEECYDSLLEFGEEFAKTYNLLKRE